MDLTPDIMPQLREDVEATVIYIRPEIYGSFFRDELEQVADGRGWVAHKADDGVLTLVCASGTNELMKRCQVFDAKNGFGMNGDRLDGFDLCSGESNRWGKATQ